MKKSPAFQLYVQDFLVGTMRFTAEQVGGYLRLLLHQWDQGHLPNHDRELLQLSGLKPKSLAKVKAKFKINADGFLQNMRLENVRQQQIANSEKQRQNGLKGGRPPKNQPVTQQAENPPVSAGLTQTEPEPNPTQSCSSFSSSSTSTSGTIHNTINTRATALSTQKDNRLTKNKFVYAPVPLPWPGTQFSAAWQAWKQYRHTEKRTAFKTAPAELAQLALLRNLSAGCEQTAIAILHQSIANTWTGIFELKNLTQHHASKQQHTANPKLPFWRKPIENGGAV